MVKAWVEGIPPLCLGLSLFCQNLIDPKHRDGPKREEVRRKIRQKGSAIIYPQNIFHNCLLIFHVLHWKSLKTKMGEFISLNRIAVLLIEICVKSGKDRVSTPSLVIHRVRFLKKLQKSSENHQFFLSFTLSFFFPERLHCCYIDFHCSYLYNYYNSSRTLCIKCRDSAFRTEFQHFILRFPYFTDTTKRGGERQGQDTVTLR